MHALIYSLLVVGSLAQCATITNPAPCGQPQDSEFVCQAKGCCYSSSSGCFYPGGNATQISRVLVVQASHFDAGFADSTVNILNRWFTQHIPRCISIGSALAANASSPVQLKFTLQSWIASLYTSCPPNAGLACPNSTQLQAFKQAVAQQWITWHAFPFNAELELYDNDFIRYGVQLTRALDAAYNATPKLVLSQRDVPGTTRSALPALAAAGVKAISIGVNGGCMPPAVPRAFMWEDAASGTRMPSMWHPYGYGGISVDDAVILPQLDTALVFDWRGDNAGPWDNVGEAYSDWAYIATQFPGAAIVSATFEDWFAAMDPVLPLLPTVTSEIGDTWIHGAGSDVQKTAWMKRWMAVVHDCVATGACDESDAAFQNFTRLALKNGEHTWGMDIKTYLHDTINWSNEAFYANWNDSNFATVRASWVEQRTWGFTYALAALPVGHPLIAPLTQIMIDIVPPPQPAPASPGWAPVTAPVSAGRFTLDVDASTCALSMMFDAVTGQNWASQVEQLGWLEYHTYDNWTYAAFIANYSAVTPPPSYIPLDLGKPNMTEARLQKLRGSCVGAWSSSNATTLLVAVHVEVLDANGSSAPHSVYGAPSDVWITYAVPQAATDGAVNVTLDMYGKTPTRLAEAAFFKFNVSRSWNNGSGSGVAWEVDKLGEWVSPFDVVLNGQQHHHAAQSGIRATKVDPAGQRNASLLLRTYDAPLTVWGDPFGLPTPTNVTADPSFGAGFYLLNNLWGTNYPISVPAIYNDGTDADIRFAFQLEFQ